MQGEKGANGGGGKVASAGPAGRVSRGSVFLRSDG